MEGDRIDADEITAWALKARTGDPAAAAAFIRATQPEVWRFVAGLVDPGAADDLTQNTYLRAFRALRAFEARASARTWLLGIARHTCADHIRSVVRARQLMTRVASMQARPDPEDIDLGARLASQELLGRLPTAQREAFV